MKRALIVYASKSGTTRKAATQLSDALAPNVDLYDCRCGLFTAFAGKVQKLQASKLNFASYSTIAVGSAMYMGRPMKAFSTFCAACEPQLISKNIFLFTCGIGTQAEDLPYLQQRTPELIVQQALLYRHLGGEIHKGLFSNMILQEYQKTHTSAPTLDTTAIAELASAIRKTLA